ncbi:hypothetical protein [Exiguobacterium chiriqhucha]|uniref:Uncharacterized protein n=1 Tax=Exiguobacterium chiriqhucha RW-2 TaxID=1345023 RepID=U1LHE3_9BACL|nr:hypothetical protein [Exiguobacterium chiriqhucha]ERG66768.1 hypothetical protein M467_05690 [Exiguobacterium chiriqhucha RW-2]
MERQMFTTDGASRQARLLTMEDAAQLRALQETDLRFIRIGYDSVRSWLAIDLDNGELFFCDDEYRPSDVIRTPIETVMSWAPTKERLLLLTQRLNLGELSEQEFPRNRNTPTFEEMIEWILYVKTGVLTRENVSSWAGRVLWQSENEMMEGTMLDALNELSVIDMPGENGSYFYDEVDLDEWIEQMRKGMRQDED